MQISAVLARFPELRETEILMWVETQLSGEVLPGTDDLADILAKFMEVAQ